MQFIKKGVNSMKSLLFLLLVITFVFSNTLFSETMSYIEDIEIGCGYNSIEEVVLDSPFKKIAAKKTSVKIKSNATISQVHSTLDIEKALGISMDDSFDSNFLKKDSNISFLRNLSFNRYTLTYLIHINVKSFENLFIKSSMESEAEKVFKSDSTLFFEAFGDRFVQRISYGGEFTGVIQIDTQSKDDMKITSAEISKSGIDWKNYKKFESAVIKASKNHRMTISHFAVGGNKNSKLNTVKEVITYARNFIDNIKITPVPVKVLLSDYSAFPGYNIKIKKKYNDVIKTKKQLVRNYLEYNAMLKDVEYLLNNKKRFHWKTPSSPGHMRSRRNKLDEFLKSLHAKLAKIIDGDIKPQKYVHLEVPKAIVYGKKVLFPQEINPDYKSVNNSYPKYSHYYEKDMPYINQRSGEESKSIYKNRLFDFWFKK